ncbi:hypothetical protein CKO50_20355 [Pseudoalteromonas sp. HM-SA03]|uniref:hypothetical protein n=1 Tax=Pseudoalteromonas sp. HM-SA03 TaxID=2029678 RepID=UPI000BADF0D2|nr:hypothetical protein [Pseudoalteromonas sp. HM-SA03]PAX99566.1 hypothetical protein CKO50_20355 [Pseudoalteromonas sp. HM-SA03]
MKNLNNGLNEKFKQRTIEVFRRVAQKCVDHKKRILQKDFDLLIDSFKKDGEYSEDNLKQLKYEYNRIIKQRIEEKQKNKKKDYDHDAEKAKESKSLLPENKKIGIEENEKSGEKIYKFRL